jgi:CRP-like cAMP-binding protein
MPFDTDPKQNLLLAALPEPELQRWLPILQSIDMPLGQVLYESGDVGGHVYFPTSAVCSLLLEREGDTTTEIAVVGREGLVGIALFVGGESTPSRAVVQSAGQGFCIGVHAVKEDFDRGGSVMRLILRYCLALTTQMVQTIACMEHHTLDQQLCRLLLLSLDRLQGDNPVVTERLIGDMLGVPGDGASACAHRLQQIGLIRYERGNITVLDRTALEERACECYATVKKEYERLLPEALAV